MQRQLIKQGRNALTVTLPAKWLAAKKLHAGDSIHLDTSPRQITITANARPNILETTVDVRGLSQGLTNHILQGRYIEGYDRMLIQHDPNTDFSDLGAKFVGMVVESHHKGKTALSSAIKVPEEGFENILRRSSFLLLDQAECLVLVAQKKATSADVSAKERLLDYHINYCMRYVNKYTNVDHPHRYFLLCSTLESAGDYLSIMAQHIGTHAHLAQGVHRATKAYIKHLFAGDLPACYNAVRSLRSAITPDNFIGGLAYALAEQLNNFIGYLFEPSAPKAQLPS